MIRRAQNHGGTGFLVLGLLAILLVLVGWAVWSGPEEAPEPLDPTLVDIGSNPDGAEPPEEAQLEGPTAAELGGPVGRDVQLPVIGSVRGKVHAESWVEWPTDLRVVLSQQATGEAVASEGVAPEEPEFLFPRVEFGNYRLSLYGDGILETHLLVTVSPTSARQHFYVPLQSGASVYGQVRDRNGKAVVGVQVSAKLQSDQVGRFHEPLTTITDEEGKYRIRGLRPDQEYEVMVGNPFHRIGESKFLGVSRFAPEAWAEFEIPPMGRARIVVDFADGRAVQERYGRVLRVKADKMGEAPGYSHSLPLDEEWGATFVALPPGEYSFTVYGGSFRRVLRSLTVSTDYEASLTIPVFHRGEGKRPR